MGAHRYLHFEAIRHAVYARCLSVVSENRVSRAPGPEMTTETPPLFLFLAAALSLGTVLALRAWFPLRRWLAFTLAIVCGPAGHLYLPGAARYVLLMYAAWLGLLFATPLPPLISA